MYLNHITLSTGHLARTSRADVTDETIKALKPWLQAALDYVDPYPLPGPLGARDGFVMSASTQDGALICHVGRPKAQPTAVIRIRLPIALHAQVIELGGDIFVKRVIREAVELGFTPTKIIVERLDVVPKGDLK